MFTLSGIQEVFRRYINVLTTFDIIKFSGQHTLRAHLYKLLNKYNIDAVIDVGANEGQFGSHLRNLGYNGEIYSFEPVKSAYEKLSHISRNDNKWFVYNFALFVVSAEIKLTDHLGQPFQLTSLRGKVVLAFFGFSNCTTECPATLAIIRQALETTALTSQDVQVVMVSTDIERDTPASMQAFMARFSPAFLGLLGSPSDLEKTWQDYNVTVLDGGETHSSFTYVVDKKGSLRETFSPDTSPDDLANDLRLLTNEK